MVHPRDHLSGNHQMTASSRGLQAQTRIKTVPTGGLRDKLGCTEVCVGGGYLGRSRKWDEPSGSVSFQPPVSFRTGFDSYRPTSGGSIDGYL